MRTALASSGITLLVSLAWLAGCTVGPNYRRPAVDVPASVPECGSTSGNALDSGAEKWWTVFQDAELQKLIRTALDQNYDVRIAASRILQAQAQVGITRSQQFPQVSGTRRWMWARRSRLLVMRPFELQGVFSWNLDFWGQYRRATEAARANLLASEWNRNLVLSTVVDERRFRLFPASRAGSGTGNREEHARFAAGIASAHQHSGTRRRHQPAGCAAGRATGGNRGGNDSGDGTPDRDA